MSSREERRNDIDKYFFFAVLFFCLVLIDGCGVSENADYNVVKSVIANETARAWGSSESAVENSDIHEGNQKISYEIGQLVNVEETTIDSEDSWGTDMPEILFVSDERLIITCYKGVFVYDKTEHRIYRSLDRRATCCDYTQSDDFTELYASENGEKVYLSSENKEFVYVFDVDLNTLTKYHYSDSFMEQFDVFDNYDCCNTEKNNEYDMYDNRNDMDFTREKAWYYNKAGVKIYTILNDQYTYNYSEDKLIDLSYCEYAEGDPKLGSEKYTFNPQDDYYESIFKEEYQKIVCVTGLKGEEMTFHDTKPAENLYLMADDETVPDDAYITGVRGIGKERTVTISQSAKYKLYDGFMHAVSEDMDVPILKKVSKKRFVQYVNKELKNRDCSMKEESHYSQPICGGIPFLIKVENGICVNITKCYEV